MPIYEYRCSKCGVFEATQRITQRSLKRCPTCNGRVERIISATSFILKGSGWYATDYARAGGTAPSEASSNPPASAETSSNGTAAAAGSSDTAPKPASDKPAAEKKSPAAKPAD